MGRRVDDVGRAAYTGVWRVLERWLRVPRGPVELPPALTTAAALPDVDEDIDMRRRGFRPDPGFLRYLRIIFWVICVIIDLGLLVVWIVILAASPIVGAVLAPLFLAVMVIPDVIAYVALHLRYDTTWYAMNDRSLRIRRGVMVIRETTLTFENIQNVSIQRGPLEQFCGIARLIVETAGGGGGAGEAGGLGPHVGVIEGMEDPEAIRDLIMARVRASRSAGLGDEPEERRDSRRAAWSPAHVQALRDIAGELRPA